MKKRKRFSRETHPGSGALDEFSQIRPNCKYSMAFPEGFEFDLGGGLRLF